jgi:hypothetical protein
VLAAPLVVGAAGGAGYCFEGGAGAVDAYEDVAVATAAAAPERGKVTMNAFVPPMCLAKRLNVLVLPSAHG